MIRTIIHIVPKLPPQNTGVGDYATLVGCRMEELDTTVVCGYVAAGQNAVELPADSPKIRNITGRCEATALWRTVEELAGGVPENRGVLDQQSCKVSVVLNYSGYGYDRNGCPMWLVEALRFRPKWVERIVTYFHELYATGRPWRRVFWYSLRQRRIAAEIAQRSDVVVTNRAASARWLEQANGSPAGTIAGLPVPSNVGEPALIPSLDVRPMRAVAFGNERWKRFALSSEAASVASILHRIGIRELVDIGSPVRVERSRFERAVITVRQLGYLPSADVSRELAQCRLGFVEYPLYGAAKSGVFAAYAAHGVVPVLKSSSVASEDALAFGKHCFSLEEAGGLEMGALREANRHIAQWYVKHNIERHAASLLGECAATMAHETQIAAVDG